MKIKMFNMLNESLYDVKVKNAKNLSDSDFVELTKFDPELYDKNFVSDDDMKQTSESFMRWILGMYRSGKLKQQSQEEVRNLLKTFKIAKDRRNLLPDNDINSYKSINELENALSSIKDSLSVRQKNRDAKKASEKLKKAEKQPGMYMDGAVELLFYGKDWEVWTPHTYEGSKALRRGATWCTGGDTDYHYNEYSSNGTLYVIMNKADNAEKYQLWASNGETSKDFEFRDKENDEKSFRMLCHDNPELLHFFETRKDVMIAYPRLNDEDLAVEEQDRISWDDEIEEGVIRDFNLIYDDIDNILVGIPGNYIDNSGISMDIFFDILENRYTDNMGDFQSTELKSGLIGNTSFAEVFYEHDYFDPLIKLFQKENPNHKLTNEMVADTLFKVDVDDVLDEWLTKRESGTFTSYRLNMVDNIISTVAYEGPIFSFVEDICTYQLNFSIDNYKIDYDVLSALKDAYTVPYKTEFGTVREFYDYCRENDIDSLEDFIRAKRIEITKDDLEETIKSWSDFDYYEDFAEEDASAICSMFMTNKEYNEMIDESYTVKNKDNINKQLNEVLRLAGLKESVYNEPDDEENFKSVKKNGMYIQYIKNPSKLVQFKAVKQDGDAIKFIKNPSKLIQLTAVKQNGYAIRFIENPSEELQLEAVKRYGYAIRFIDNPSEKVQLEAVKQNGDAIQCIKNPSEQVQLMAVKQKGNAIRYIHNPSEMVQIESVKQDSINFNCIFNPTPKVIALQKKLWG